MYFLEYWPQIVSFSVPKMIVDGHSRPRAMITFYRSDISLATGKNRDFYLTSCDLYETFTLRVHSTVANRRSTR